ncbi:DUF6923 family protein [Maribacter sp. X9]|uniref:DUF6923 family protein n=1 Tax=Maribacter sp. X9 TaxID=3402159 RepID=UPI003AF3D9C7
MVLNYTLRYFSKWLVVLFLSIVANLKLTAQSPSFECDYNAYLFQYNDIYALDLASGSSYLVAEDITPGNINAAAYNSSDGYLWGYLSTPQISLVRIGKDFSAEIFSIPNLPNNGNKYVGDISIDGIYYFKAGPTTYYSVDLNPESNNYLTYLGSNTLNKSINIHDWAFNAVDNMLYSVEKGTNHLYKINVVTGTVEDLGEVPILSGFNYTYGAVYFDVAGNFYVSANQTGSVYKINDVQNIIRGEMTSNIFAFGPAASSNDGARCPTAPVPQEDCKNGIDDDGDGLVDCDDPSCSGIAACPVITTTSTSNQGGLESNDRLANLINNRNYKRVKSNYIFNKLTAKKVVKDKMYMKSRKNDIHAIPLATLVPLNIVGETITIESSPVDLLDLTNASDIFSVDYLNGIENLASIMIIKTDKKVYEHSKFICDRFLGAELLSVATIQLREHDFIRSIIKQPDGSLEYSLSFSARVNEADNFVIESHWNIDAYKEGTPFYNFQIWANSIDALLALAEEALNLLEVNAVIATYNGSMPPPVFVKSASYSKGEVFLNLVNNNNSKSIRLEGGLKTTETSTSQKIDVTSTIDGYLSEVFLKTGTLFDMGFRISAGLGETPDDLFVADAPWGLDSSSENTVVDKYEVLPVSEPYLGKGYPIERNISLKGTTQNYLGVYRAMSPRFAAVDLSDYEKLSFSAKGTGKLEVVILKGDGIHYKATVQLSNELKEYTLSQADFKSELGNSIDFSSIKVLSFNLKAENGYQEEKTLQLRNIDFNNRVGAAVFVDADLNKSMVYPNPLVASTEIFFYEHAAARYELDLFTLDGRTIGSHHQEGDTVEGQNSLTIHRKGLAPGLYLYRIKSSNEKIWSGRLVVQ